MCVLLLLIIYLFIIPKKIHLSHEKTEILRILRIKLIIN